MFVVAVVVVDRAPVAPGPTLRRAASLYAVGSNPEAAIAGRAAGTADHGGGLRGVWGTRRAGWVPDPRPLRHDHRDRRSGPRVGVDRSCRRRRGEHARGFGDDRRQLLRRGAHRPARPEPGACARDQRVRPRRGARPADPPRGGSRRLAVAPLRPPPHDHGLERRCATGRPGNATDADIAEPARAAVLRVVRRERGMVGDVARRNPWETLLLVILVGTIVFNVTQSDNYLGVHNLVNLFQLSIEKAIVVVMMTFIIIAGEIDLSVASVMCLSAAILGRLNDGGSVPFPLAMLIAVAAGSAAGFVQGWCVARLALPSLVVTLAGLIGLRGLARVFVEDRSYGGFPSWFNTLGQDDIIGPFPFAVLLFLVGIVVAGVILARTALGRRVYVIGDNAEVARYSAIDVGAMKIRLFVASGHRRRDRRSALRRPPRLGARRPRRGLRAGHRDDGAPRRREHLRWCRHDDRRRPGRADRAQPAQRSRTGQRRGEHPDRRDRRDPHRVGARPQRHRQPAPALGQEGAEPRPRTRPARRRSSERRDERISSIHHRRGTAAQRPRRTHAQQAHTRHARSRRPRSGRRSADWPVPTTGAAPSPAGASPAGRGRRRSGDARTGPRLHARSCCPSSPASPCSTRPTRGPRRRPPSSARQEAEFTGPTADNSVAGQIEIVTNAATQGRGRDHDLEQRRRPDRSGGAAGGRGRRRRSSPGTRRSRAVKARACSSPKSTSTRPAR